MKLRDWSLVLAVMSGIGLVSCGAGSAKSGTSVTPSRASVSGPAAFAKTRDTGGFDESPYDFAKPVVSFSLPGDLEEISGLTVLDETHLGAVQDEKAHLYLINAANGIVDEEIDFGKKGDYEGIAEAAGRLFVLQSGGELTELLGWRTGEVMTREYDGDLGRKRCNAEGLGADGGRLLIICKNADKKDRNAVHAFDLASNTFSEKEIFEVDADDLSGKKTIRPSGLARHPISGDWLVLSSKRQSIVVVDDRGKVKAEWDIRQAGLEQPEGIIVLPDGDLWLSSEGRKGPGRVMRFGYRG